MCSYVGNDHAVRCMRWWWESACTSSRRRVFGRRTSKRAGDRQRETESRHTPHITLHCLKRKYKVSEKNKFADRPVCVADSGLSTEIQVDTDVRRATLDA